MLEFDFNPFPVLQSDRLLLREIKEEDALPYFHVRADQHVNQYMDSKLFTDIQEAIDVIQRIKVSLDKNEGVSWAISLKNNPKLIGMIGFWRTFPEHHRAEIGYSLHPDHWNEGIMSEALGMIIQYGFDKMKIHSIEANVNPHNIASIKILTKQGFVQEAHFRENYFYNGNFLDSYIFSLLEKNWTGKK